MDQELAKVNALAQRYGLELSMAQLESLGQTERQTLADTGRVCFGESILPVLVYAFCDSPYMAPSDAAETLQTLVELFYQLKTETQDALSDDELITAMAAIFNGPAHGSLLYLADVDGRMLYRYALSREGER